MTVLPLEQIIAEAKALNRSHDLMLQTVPIRPQWWQRNLRAYGLESIGSRFTETELSRSDLFRLAPAAQRTTEELLEFVFKVIAWGSGTRPRNNLRRISNICASESQEILKEGIRRAAQEDWDSFDVFRSSHKNLIPFLGPAFFTKIMYFSGSGNPTHPLLIVDQRVMRTLKLTEYASRFTRSANYDSDTYAEICNALTEISNNVQRQTAQDCTPDLIELWAFLRNGQPAAKQP